MKHPTPEQWAQFVYRDAPPATLQQWERHLNDCAPCQSHVASLRQVQQALNQWTLPTAQPAPRPRRPATLARWAAAALFTFGLGLGLGRWTGPDTRALRSQLEGSIRSQLTAEFDRKLQDGLRRVEAAAVDAATTESRAWVARASTQFAAQREDDLDHIYDTIATVDAQRRADATAQRQALETVAIRAESGLLQTHQQLVSLADSRSPALSTTPNH